VSSFGFITSLGVPRFTISISPSTSTRSRFDMGLCSEPHLSRIRVKTWLFPLAKLFGLGHSLLTCLQACRRVRSYHTQAFGKSVVKKGNSTALLRHIFGIEGPTTAQLESHHRSFRAERWHQPVRRMVYPFFFVRKDFWTLCWLAFHCRQGFSRSPD